MRGSGDGESLLLQALRLRQCYTELDMSTTHLFNNYVTARPVLGSFGMRLLQKMNNVHKNT